MKRGALLLAGIAGLATGSLTTPLARATPADRLSFEPPAGDLVLTRTVWRYLPDGQQIRVERSYAVRFLAEVGGFRLEGRLIDAVVDAPADLAPFAELERTRPDPTLFPVRLDAEGRVRADGTAPQAETRLKAAALARATLARAALTGADRQAADQQVATLSAGPGVYGAIPADLFRPRPGERRERRRIPLPGGMEGEVEVAIRVEGIQQSGLPSRVERTVTTELAGTARVSREVWTLAPKT